MPVCCIRSNNEEGHMAAGDRLGRIVFRNTEESSQEISVDLIFVGPQPKGGIEYYGLWQDRHEDVRCPFTLSPEGQVDFGAGYDEADRYYETDMLEKEMSVGQRISWKCEDDVAEFAVVSMTPLI
jgi:hypothetical protein